MPVDRYAHIRCRLKAQRQAHRYRQLSPITPRGPFLYDAPDTSASSINLASNDYLGLSQHPHLIQAVRAAAESHGVGAGASRLVVGHQPIHQQLESRFAHFKHAEAALLLPTGYMANAAVLTSLPTEGDLICMDKLNHASLIDAAQASPATLRIFRHRDYDKLERLLSQSDAPHKYIVTDAVFSMDGDTADLARLVALRDRYDAIVILDEAHATGVLGPHGGGLAEHHQLSEQVDLVISTASKALGALGGIVTGPAVLIEALVNFARSFIYTTAVPPTQVAAIDAALDVLHNEPERRQRLQQIITQVHDALRHSPWADVLPGHVLEAEQPTTPILPLICGDEQAAMDLSSRLRDAGFYAPAIRPPTVAPGSARVRLCLRADLEDGHVDRLIQTLQKM